MKCIVCGTGMTYFFTKKFTDFDLNEVEYHKCPECGFCASATHYEMSPERWEKLNHDFHTIHNDSSSQYNSAQRWFNQALMLQLLQQNGFIKYNDNWLDYACGEGNLSIQLKENFGLHIWNYDRYMTPLLNVAPANALSKKYSAVVNGAFFEHVRDRAALDEVHNLVSENGVLAVHTLVREDIPNDPSWFYLLPVHTSFYSNKSMDILIRQWGYTCSVYNEFSQLWIFFKDKSEKIEKMASDFNKQIGWEYLHYKAGFMDYWKNP